MKKIVIAVIFTLAFVSCEKEFDGVVEVDATSDTGNKIVNVELPDSFFISSNNRLLTFSVMVERGEKTPVLSASLKKGGTRFASEYLTLSEENSETLTYTGLFTLDTNYHTGFYSVNFWLDYELASVSTVYIRGLNHTPYVFNLQMPDTVSVSEQFIFSVEANDADGTSDIAAVYYNVYDPNGNLVRNSQGVSDFPLSDNGDTAETGDEVADDQIYTMKLAFPQGSQTGVWRFDFFAIDKAREKSNVISHIITVMP
jgi:hypothetical protein